jgi:hypothetical protein
MAWSARRRRTHNRASTSPPSPTITATTTRRAARGSAGTAPAAPAGSSTGAAGASPCTPTAIPKHSESTSRRTALSKDDISATDAGPDAPSSIAPNRRPQAASLSRRWAASPAPTRPSPRPFPSSTVQLGACSSRGPNQAHRHDRQAPRPTHRAYVTSGLTESREIRSNLEWRLSPGERRRLVRQRQQHVDVRPGTGRRRPLETEFE